MLMNFTNYLTTQINIEPINIREVNLELSQIKLIVDSSQRGKEQKKGKASPKRQHLPTRLLFLIVLIKHWL